MHPAETAWRYLDGRAGAGPFQHLDAVNFMFPPMAVTVVLGLSLDYDVFLLGRMAPAPKKKSCDKKRKAAKEKQRKATRSKRSLHPRIVLLRKRS